MMPMWHHSVSMYGHIGEHIYAKTFCADYLFWLHPKSSFGNQTIKILLRIHVFPFVYFICVGIPILKIVLPHAHKWVISDVIL